MPDRHGALKARGQTPNQRGAVVAAVKRTGLCEPMVQPIEYTAAT